MTLSKILGLIEAGRLDIQTKIFFRDFWRTDQFRKQEQIVRPVVFHTRGQLKSRYQQKRINSPNLWLRRTSQSSWRLLSESDNQIEELNREISDDDIKAADWKIADTGNLLFSL